ncbi:MAG TPA: pyridoxamine 5'-phosphate oxidase family protein, partial [Candidatus Limnocylindrales bacterium]|nr:pyridoxamine 5'-phosphate oxidase family protein [Candidatus Limnocylindrales bacterium]
GTARKIEDADQKTHALLVISEHLLQGRWAEVRGPNEKELKATSVLEFSIEEASAKVRTGPPADDEEDYVLPVWAGVLPLELTAGRPLADARLVPGVGEPDYLEQYKSATRKGTSQGHRNQQLP